MVGVHQVDAGQSVVLPAQVLDDLLHVVVHGVELHLAGTVEDDVGREVEVAQLLVQPLYVCPHELHGEHQTSVGSQLHLLHDVLHLHQVGDVDITGVGHVLVGGVEVHYGHLPAERPEQLRHGRHVGCLP